MLYLESLLDFKKQCREDKFMSEKRMMIVLPTVLLLGASAIAIGVVPGVRDWVDQTIPWLGINGPKTIAAFSIPNEPSSEMTSPLAVVPAVSVDGGFPKDNSPPRFDVQFAQATVQIPTSAPAQGLGGGLPNYPSNRLTQTPAFNTVPPTGLSVPSSRSGTLLVENAQVIFPDDSFIGAQADGIIKSLLVDDGSMIKIGDPMIEIDPRLAQAEVVVSQKELEAAELKAKDDSNMKYSEAALEVAKMDLQKSNELLQQGAEDIMLNEKKRLESKKAFFQVSVSKIEKLRDTADVGVKSAKLGAAEVQMDLRKIVAQRSGMVSEITKRQSDWVRAGEPILRLTSMEKLRIKANVKVTDSPHLLQNAAARVTIFFAEGKGETVDGSVTFVSPRAVNRNQYQIHVDVPNRLTPDGQFLFREGMVANVEITPRSN